MQAIIPFRRPGIYIPEFDGLRAVAVLAVMAGHAAVLDHPIRGSACGFIAVRFFFVLSGFLITGILLDHVVSSRNRGKSLAAFLVRRGLRIFPAYFAFLIFFLFIGNSFVMETIGWTATYTSNFAFAFVTKGGPPITHFWTLAVEEQFYLIWPLALICFSRTPKLLGAVLLFGVASAVTFRELALNYELTRSQLLYLPISSLDSLLLGAASAILLRNPSRFADRLVNLLRRVGIFVAAPMLCCGLLSIPLGWDLGFNLLTTGQWLTALAATGIVIHYASQPSRGIVSRILLNRQLRYLGMISYGMYLYHFPIDRIIYERIMMQQLGLPDHFLLHFSFVCICTTAIATLSWYLLEKPILGWKHSFPYDATIPQKTTAATPLRKAA